MVDPEDKEILKAIQSAREEGELCTTAYVAARVGRDESEVQSALSRLLGSGHVVSIQTYWPSVPGSESWTHSLFPKGQEELGDR